MRWIEAFHLICVICWFAGLFYLPRLFVYHAMSTDQPSLARFKIMERKLYYGIMMPSAILTLLSGIWLLSFNWHSYWQADWLRCKLFLVLLLFIFHGYCGKLYRNFKYDRNPYSHVFFRWLNEIPTVLLIGIIIMAIVHPF